MPRCPQCGKESKSLYITSSGVCVECNRLNYQKKEEKEKATSEPVIQEPFEEVYLKCLQESKILNIPTNGFTTDELHKLVTVQIAKFLKNTFYLLILILVVIPIINIII